MRSLLTVAGGLLAGPPVISLVAEGHFTLALCVFISGLCLVCAAHVV